MRPVGRSTQNDRAHQRLRRGGVRCRGRLSIRHPAGRHRERSGDDPAGRAQVRRAGRVRPPETPGRLAPAPGFWRPFLRHLRARPGQPHPSRRDALRVADQSNPLRRPRERGLVPLRRRVPRRHARAAGAMRRLPLARRRQIVGRARRGVARRPPGFRRGRPFGGRLGSRQRRLRRRQPPLSHDLRLAPHRRARRRPRLCLGRQAARTLHPIE